MELAIAITNRHQRFCKMLFSELISALESGKSGLQSHELQENPNLIGGASLEQAKSNEISFLEKGNYLKATLNESCPGAILIPPQEDLRSIAEEKKNCLGNCSKPKISFRRSS